MSIDFAVHRNSLYVYILKRVRDPWVSEDLVQETLARLLAYARRESVTNARALAFHIATNLVRDHFRALSRTDTEPLNEELASDSPAQEHVSIHRERVEAFVRALEAMPPLRRDVFVRRRLHGESYDEIGKALGLNPAAVEKHMVRALEWLHRQISAHDEGRKPLGRAQQKGSSQS